MGKKGVEDLSIVHPNAAGLDIGAGEIYGCMPADRGGETVQRFETFTPDLERLADWLIANEVDTVAMESTGVHWIPAFEMLEARGMSSTCPVANRTFRTANGCKSCTRSGC